MAGTGEEALWLAQEHDYDAMVLDLPARHRRLRRLPAASPALKAELDLARSRPRTAEELTAALDSASEEDGLARIGGPV